MLSNQNMESETTFPSHVNQVEFFFITSDQEQLTRILGKIAEQDVNLSTANSNRYFNKIYTKIFPGLPRRDTTAEEESIVKKILADEGLCFFENRVITINPNALRQGLLPVGDQRPGLFAQITSALTPQLTIYTLTLNETGWFVVATNNNREALKLLELN